jgi:uncharacterized coiled-coil protein SlyX
MGDRSMQEDRIADLERRVTSLEIRRLHDESLVKDNAPPEQGRHLRELNENMTILLGVIGNQGQDIKEMKELLRGVVHRLDSVDQRFYGVERSSISLKEKFEQRFTSLEGKFDQVLQMLTTLTTKTDE